MNNGRMVILVDTYNCLHAAGRLCGSGGPLPLAAFCRLCRSAPGRVILVMDGTAKPGEPTADEFPNLRFVYPGSGKKADPVIGRLVCEFRDRNPLGKGLLVISSDRAVLHQARGEKAATQSAEAFVRNLLSRRGNSRAAGHSPSSKAVHRNAGRGAANLSAARTEKQEISAETRRWLEIFGFATTDVESKRPAVKDTQAARPQAKSHMDHPVDKANISNADDSAISALLGPVQPLKAKAARSRASVMRRRKKR